MSVSINFYYVLYKIGSLSYCTFLDGGSLLKGFPLIGSGLEIPKLTSIYLEAQVSQIQNSQK